MSKKRIHIGIHIAARDIADIARLNMTACQIFTIVPQKLQLVRLDMPALQAAAKSAHIWIHTSYLVSPWGDAEYNMPFAIKQLRHQVEIGGRGVVFHLPKAPASMLAPRLLRLIKNRPAGSRVVLENKAVRPDPVTSFETPEKINAMIDTFVRAGIALRDIWLCIDTAHLYCSRVPLRSRADASRWLSRLKYPDRIAAFHLNGNSSKTFSDRHSIAFGPDDLIWGGTPFAQSGVAAIRDFCLKHDVDVIIECNFESERRRALQLISRMNK